MDRLKEPQVRSEWGKLISGNISEEWAFSLLFNLFSLVQGLRTVTTWKIKKYTYS